MLGQKRARWGSRTNTRFFVVVVLILIQRPRQPLLHSTLDDLVTIEYDVVQQIGEFFILLLDDANNENNIGFNMTNCEKGAFCL